MRLNINIILALMLLAYYWTLTINSAPIFKRSGEENQDADNCQNVDDEEAGLDAEDELDPEERPVNASTSLQLRTTTVEGPMTRDQVHRIVIS